MKKAICIPIIFIIVATIIMSLGYICAYDASKKIGYETGYNAGYFDAKEIYEPELEKLSKQYEELAKKENRSASNFIEYLIKMWEKNK